MNPPDIIVVRLGAFFMTVGLGIFLGGVVIWSLPLWFRWFEQWIIGR